MTRHWSFGTFELRFTARFVFVELTRPNMPGGAHSVAWCLLNSYDDGLARDVRSATCVVGPKSRNQKLPVPVAA